MLIIKVGGGKTINWHYIAQDVVKLGKRQKIVIVHGASAQRDEIARKLNLPTKTVVSPSGITSVYTSQKSLDIFLMVYAGLVNKKIIAILQKYGINAVGLSGVDGRLWEGKRKSNLYIQDGIKTKLITDNLTGKVEKVNANLLYLLLKNKYVPLVCPPAISYDQEIINTDNDFAIAQMAKALNVKKLISLFEAPGLLKDPVDENSLIPKVKRKEIADFLQYAKGRMKKKLLGAKKAFECGVEIIYWGDGRIKNPVTNALRGKGTIIS